VDKKQERMQLLERQCERLRRRITRLDERSNFYSWTRVIVFFGGLLISTVGFIVIWWLGLATALLVLTGFACLAYLHGKVEHSLARHTLLLHIQTTYIARMKLDWEQIPSAHSEPPPENHPFALDLDITGKRSLHQLLNMAISREGSQRLCDWLLAVQPDLETIHARQTLVQELIPLRLFRDKLVMHSLLATRRATEHVEGQRLLRWLEQHSSSPHELRLLVLGSAVLNILTVVLFVLTQLIALPQLWIFSLLCAVIMLFTTADKRGDIFEDAVYLRYAFATLGAVFTYLEKYPYAQHTRLQHLCKPFFVERQHSPSRLLQRLEGVASAATLKNNSLLWLIINALVPWDAYCAYRLSHYRTVIADRLPTWLDVWFELEAINSLATFAYLNPEYTLPQVISHTGLPQQDGKLFQALELGHPLIPVDKKVSNSFAFAKTGEVVIITGSNMAGKSTFLRTLGINLCLAYAGSVVDAHHLHTELFTLFTCIRVSDSVIDGYSYFYAEVKRLRRMLDALQQCDLAMQRPLFFLIDEIFKGTNNRERLSGSRAYIRALIGHHCVGAISTHDLELVKLTDVLQCVHNYHFREEVVDGNMVFDYVLRAGPCPTTNALKIMQMEGLPVE